MVIADTSALLALFDADDQNHEAVRESFESERTGWVLPWAILPEIDYMLMKYGGAAVERAFVQDLAEGRFVVEWGQHRDITRARELIERYNGFNLGLTDAIVMATAERLRARAIATLDRRHFGAVTLKGSPELIPVF